MLLILTYIKMFSLSHVENSETQQWKFKMAPKLLFQCYQTYMDIPKTTSSLKSNELNSIIFLEFNLATGEISSVLP